MEQLTLFLEDPNDAYTRDNFLNTIERLWYKWTDFYYIHILDYPNRKGTKNPEGILLIPTYVRDDIEQLKGIINEFGNSVYDKDKLTIDEKLTILTQIEQDLDGFNKFFIEHNADLLARLQAFREMVYPKKISPKDKDGEVIPFRKDDK